MFQWFRAGSDALAKMAALSRSLALIEFNPDGTIIWANENFCQALGYGLEEIRGKDMSLDNRFRHQGPLG
ncbi:MAG TPA: PAS domain-containing protein [Acidiphilium sp.]|nr:PAS domain-containing protein [Acidiphilium sp.]